MVRRLVVDSSADLALYATDSLRSVPLKIRQGNAEYVDDAELDVPSMMDEMSRSRERSFSSCPNVYDWLSAFEGADELFVVAISSNMSGSYATANQAAEEYRELHPDSKVFVVDSLNAGPGVAIMVEYLNKLCQSNRTFDEVVEAFTAYKPHVHMVFTMESISNLVKNGRVSPAIAALAGVLGLRFVNRASAEGTFEQLKKVRGTSRVYVAMVEEMKNLGYAGGKVLIHHALNMPGAQVLQEKLKNVWPNAEIKIRELRGLCSFYAEKGGLLVGFEDESTPVIA